MNSIDEQIAQKIINSVSFSDDWSWVPYYKDSCGWMRKGNLKIKAFEHMTPSDAWNYICVYVGDEEWKVPFELRKRVWEAAYPTFEKVRALEKESIKSKILRMILP